MLAGLVFGLAVPAQADDLEDLAIGQAWRGWSDARLVVPTAGLPYELNPTPTAFSRSYVDAVPGRSSAFASFYYADEILGTMIAVAPISGIARVVQATPDVALPIGYDLDVAFEELDPDPPA